MSVEPRVSSSFSNVLVVEDDNKRRRSMINLVDLIELEDEDNDDIIVTHIITKEGTRGDGASSSRRSVITSRRLEESDAICVEKYCEERELNYAMQSYLLRRSTRETDLCEIVQCVDDYEDSDEIRILPVKPFSFAQRKPFTSPSLTEIGESSSSQSGLGPSDEEEQKEEKVFDCEICADTKPRSESFVIKGCTHAYCADCMRNYVASKLEEGVSQINCPIPNCRGVLEPDYCRDIIPLEVFNWWGNVLCESVILASEKFYCPFKDCSALLIDDGREVVTTSECPNCWRLFCAKCKVPWHEGIDCDEFQKLSKDEREKEDIMLKNLAKNKQWQRCPKCKVYVERTEGCLYIKCRCGTAFCYRCGNINKDDRYHHCSNCQKVWG